MRGVRIRDFTDDDVPAAGRLLAARQAAHRRAEPLLRPLDDAAAADAVRTAWARPDASGAVAERDGALVGYLVGAPKDATWGANVWVDAAGHAVAAGDEEVARDLYAHAAAGWVQAGRTAHYALLPAGPSPLADAWFRLAFGLQHVHAVREPAPAPAPPAGLVVRPAEQRDVRALARLDLVLPAHQGRAPVFAAGPAPTFDEAVAEWESGVDDPDFPTWVAATGDGDVVGAATGCALARSSMHEGPALVPDAGFLGFAAVLLAARGLGAGRALGEAVLGWSHEAGHAACVTDWRATNLLSSRAWPRLGFRDTFWRLHRLVGH